MKEFILAQNELQSLFEELPNQGIILLRGDLASGKTTLVKEFSKYLGFNENVSSPTFALMQKYTHKNQVLYHYDFYQIGFEGILKNGLFENFYEEALHLVEWGDELLKTALKKMGLESLNIEIEILKNKRKYVIYE
ncbi:MAG: tRNA (adenosine(37)-N6)-threonylcarbamoyltransferase complex ATPase subunit type 1 TsaE [Campylobacter sp.]|nr:tRNA (adenosine(37)-N6)-threonylcarbamoyltransferase complex ATPase subunit type 1 TsaE [Campylobacter sp.]